MMTEILNTRHKKMFGRMPQCILVVLFFMITSGKLMCQSVTEIITDYNGYWKTGTASVNAVRPDNHHNLLSFTYNSTRYSTGVNDALLTSHGETFTPGVFNALPMQNSTGTPTSNTKIGLGAMVDGVYNGAGSAPSRILGPYLNDGTNGLDMGTCVANIPAGTMFLSVSNLQAAKIGDGVPDILVTQIADPSTSYDSYEFTDVNGVRIGNSLNVVLNTISPVGNWVADFYEATGATILAPGFTQTQRPIRLWVADFTSFGINASNIAGIAYFKITLSGTSDIAFVGYNTMTISIQQVLDLPAAIVNRQRPQRVQRPDETNSLLIFPNPAGRFVNFVHPPAKAGDKISLYNLSGIQIMQLIPSVNTTKTRADFPSMRPGNYQVIYTTNEKRFLQKLMVK